VDASESTGHRLATTVGTPATIKGRAAPTAPSPRYCFSIPVWQADRTTSRVRRRFNPYISYDWRIPSDMAEELEDSGARGNPERISDSSFTTKCIAKWATSAVFNSSTIFDSLASSPTRTLLPLG